MNDTEENDAFQIDHVRSNKTTLSKEKQTHSQEQHAEELKTTSKKALSDDEANDANQEQRI